MHTAMEFNKYSKCSVDHIPKYKPYLIKCMSLQCVTKSSSGKERIIVCYTRRLPAVRSGASKSKPYYTIHSHVLALFCIYKIVFELLCALFCCVICHACISISTGNTKNVIFYHFESCIFIRINVRIICYEIYYTRI